MSDETRIADLRIAVLAGGDSFEREISLLSGENVQSALQQQARDVYLIDPLEQPLDQIDWGKFDLAFIALHGTYGEDGQAQRQLECLSVRYTGSNASASALAFDKLATKAAIEEHNLPTPASIAVLRDDSDEQVERQAAGIGYPLVAKPNASGSSLGVTVVESAEALQSAVSLARQYSPTILLERFIPGEEWTVGILDDLILPPLRVGSAHEFFDYSAKYSDEQTRYELISMHDSRTAREVGEISREACQIIGCCGICRVDLRVDPYGHAWLLEVNTVPGLTKRSLVPRAAAGLGWSMTDLCDRIIASALR